MDWIDRARSGEEEAWSHLHRQITPRLLAYIRGRGVLDSSLTEEDVVAEAWLTAASKIHGFKGNENQFSAWVLSMAKNHLSNGNRKADAVRTTSLETYSIADPQAFQESMVEVNEFLDHLSGTERELVLLVDLLHYNMREAATVLSVSHGNARVMHHRALKRLRKFMEDSAALLLPRWLLVASGR